jgi:Fe-S-cluster containining protein
LALPEEADSARGTKYSAMKSLAASETFTPVETFGLLEREREQLTLPVLEELERAGHRVSCRAGCGACCRQLVVLSPLEALAIREHVRGLAPAARCRLEEGHRRHSRELSRRPALVRLLSRFRAAAGYLEPAEADMLEKSYWAAQIACPFLVNDRCGIYPARPFGCREHLALSPPERCASDPDTVHTAPTRFQLRAVASVVGEQAFQTEDRLIPIHEALRYAEEHADVGRRTASAAAVHQFVQAAVRRARRFWQALAPEGTKG